MLDGLGGADLMIGGTGDDTYVVDNAKDVVQEAAGDAADLIKASISIDLAAYAEIEDVTLTGTAALKATGDEQKNHLTGNAGANLLTGNDGADTLVGDAGNDTLLGGAGVVGWKKTSYHHLHLERGIPYAISTMLHYVILLLGILRRLGSAWH